jgi:uncharacterized protein
MATILITGGTGLIGQALTAELLAKNHKVIVLTRQSKGDAYSSNLSYAQWDVAKGIIDKEAIKKADYIVHLAGANVADGRWTEKRKKEIINSRTKSAALIVKAINEIPNNIKAVISSSAIGWYGADPTIPNFSPFVETDKADASFLGSTCKAWEESLKPIAENGIRTVWLRTGIVLSNEGGAYAEFKKPMKLGVAAVLGKGIQMVSWIHIKDIARMYMYAIENENINGVYNAVAPAPVNNQLLIDAIIKEKGSVFIKTKVPEFALKLALGEMSIEVLKSTTVSSKKIENAGFQFLFPSIEAAVHNLEQSS